MNTKVELIAAKARKSISDYCYNDCKSYCCRNGYLILNEKEAKLIINEKFEEFIENNTLIKLDENKFSLNFNKNNRSCPCLVEFKCTIHKKRLRPKTCKNFPIYVNEEEKMVLISNRCFAVKEGKLYAFIYQFKNLGYKIVKGHDNSDIDFSKIIDSC
ncbi:MAG: YkgJ family cysteine cluster protein [Nanoarchaeota archaeon]